MPSPVSTPRLGTASKGTPSKVYTDSNLSSKTAMITPGHEPTGARSATRNNSVGFGTPGREAQAVPGDHAAKKCIAPESANNVSSPEDSSSELLKVTDTPKIATTVSNVTPGDGESESRRGAKNTASSEKEEGQELSGSESSPKGTTPNSDGKKRGYNMFTDGAEDCEDANDTNSSFETVPVSSDSSNKRGLVSRRGGRVGASVSTPVSQSEGDSEIIRGQSLFEYETYDGKSSDASSPAVEQLKRSGSLTKKSPGSRTPSLQPRPLSDTSGISPHFTRSRSSDKDCGSNVAENDTIPSLCSSQVELKEEMSDRIDSSPPELAEHENTGDTEDRKEGKDFRKRKPLSITCDPTADSTSPLHLTQSLDSSSSLSKNEKKQMKKKVPNSSTPVRKRPVSYQELDRRNVVTFSPSPPAPTDVRKTPTRSPMGSQFQNLPFHDAKLNSPGIFLSPYSPSAYGVIEGTLKESHSFEQAESDVKPEKVKSKGPDDDAHGDVVASTAKASEKGKERERNVTTPTNFAFDFGKGHQPSSPFDASNAFAWLHSPTGQGFFSPGGLLGSQVNTPRGAYMGGITPRTPRTPTAGTSFFFSDASPRRGEFVSPKGAAGGENGGNARGNGSLHASHPLNNMICISPLASSKRMQGKVANEGPGRTPYSHRREESHASSVNYDDVFESPRVSISGTDSARGTPLKPRNLPVLSDGTPSRNIKAKSRGGKNASLDIHMAERDLMEDEDLSVLLQLASTSSNSVTGGTPGKARERSVNQDGYRPKLVTHRQSGVQNAQYQYRQDTPGGMKANASSPNSLNLPFINGRPGGLPSPSRKAAFRDKPHTQQNEFTPPPLSIRSSSSGGSKEMYPGGHTGDDTITGGKKGGNVKASSKRKKNDEKATPVGKADAGYPASRPIGTAPSQYYTYGGGRPSGSTHVMGNSNGGIPEGHRHQYAMPQPGTQAAAGAPTPPGYPASNMGMSRPPPHTMYPHHPSHMPPPHISGMGGHHQYHPHYHPHHPHAHHHMQMYGQAPPGPAAASTKKEKKSKSPRASAKRPISGTGPPTKKKKGSPKSSAKKQPKNAGIGLSVDANGNPVDRQKAAAKIAAVNAASGGKNDKAAALAAAILRGVTMRPSGKWQAQLYYAGKSRYIGVFDTREKAALAYEIAREKLKSDNKSPADQSSQSLKATEDAVNSARKAAFEGVNEKDPRMATTAA